MRKSPRTNVDTSTAFQRSGGPIGPLLGIQSRSPLAFAVGLPQVREASGRGAALLPYHRGAAVPGEPVGTKGDRRNRSELDH